MYCFCLFFVFGSIFSLHITFVSGLNGLDRNDSTKAQSPSTSKSNLFAPPCIAGHSYSMDRVPVFLYESSSDILRSDRLRFSTPVLALQERTHA